MEMIKYVSDWDEKYTIKEARIWKPSIDQCYRLVLPRKSQSDYGTPTLRLVLFNSVVFLLQKVSKR